MRFSPLNECSGDEPRTQHIRHQSSRSHPQNEKIAAENRSCKRAFKLARTVKLKSLYKLVETFQIPRCLIYKKTRFFFHSLRFGTFMCNNDKQRNDEAKSLSTISLWAHLDNIRDAFTNENYLPNDEVCDACCQLSELLFFCSRQQIRLCGKQVLHSLRYFVTN
jgi:hypothetical protein